MGILRATLALLAVVAVSGPVQPGWAADGLVDVVVSLKKADLRPGMGEVNRARAAGVAARHGVAPAFTYGIVLAGFAGSVPPARLEMLKNDPDVESVSIDEPMYAIGKPASQGGSANAGQVVPWGVERIGATASLGSKGAGVDVYILDTGIDADHPDIQGNLGNGAYVYKCTGRSCKAPWDDNHGHGTHVAGTVAAIDNGRDVVGVAPLATLHAVKVLSGSGSGTISGIIAGIDWVAGEAQAKGTAVVANMSLGGSGSRTGTCSSGGYAGTDNFHRAICNAKNKGVVFAVAAGNSGVDAELATPAAYDDAVITVSATTSTDDWPYWSNWGNNAGVGNNSAPVAIAAPGVSVLSTKKGGGT
ncbi:MAG: S8 family serine peptidase, partial [Nitrospirota bacterium]|nr:S8 family serine peptidase [Nitrospirota bacterium]